MRDFILIDFMFTNNQVYCDLHQWCIAVVQLPGSVQVCREGVCSARDGKEVST